MATGARSDAHSNRQNLGLQHSLSREENIEHPWKQDSLSLSRRRNPSLKCLGHMSVVLRHARALVFGHGLRLQADARRLSANVRGCSR